MLTHQNNKRFSLVFYLGILQVNFASFVKITGSPAASVKTFSDRPVYQLTTATSTYAASSFPFGHDFHI